jgi:hypothetical protein
LETFGLADDSRLWSNMELGKQRSRYAMPVWQGYVVNLLAWLVGKVSVPTQYTGI